MFTIQKTPAGWQAGRLSIYPTRALARAAVREIKRAQQEAGAKVVEKAARAAIREAYARRLATRK